MLSFYFYSFSKKKVFIFIVHCFGAFLHFNLIFYFIKVLTFLQEKKNVYRKKTKVARPTSTMVDGGDGGGDGNSFHINDGDIVIIAQIPLTSTHLDE